MADNKVDIFSALNAISVKNNSFFSALTEEQQKTIVPFLLCRWLSGTSNSQQIILLNEVANPYMFSLYAHKHLMWKLLHCCTTGKSQKYIWNKLPPKVKGNHPLCSKLFSTIYGYSTKQTNDAIKCLSGDNIIEMAIEIGIQHEDLTKLKKELKEMNFNITTSNQPKTKNKKLSNPTDDLLTF